MTIQNRSKECETCGKTFYENKSDSNQQWHGRIYCSAKCNNKSKARVTDIFTRLDKFVVKIEGGCWLWTGATDGKGYGVLSGRMNGSERPLRVEKAHRVSYEKYIGVIPDGMVIRHKCDNPQCTNPDHLEVGTQKDNMRDCSSRGRLNRKSLLNLKRFSLTDKQAEEIRAMTFAGRNGRGGVTRKEVAERYGVCVDTINNIIKRG